MSGLLLDTHVFLWWAENPSRLSKKVHTLINTHPEVYLSVVVAWEIEIKQAKGKLIGDPFNWPSVLSERLLISLPVTFDHVIKLRKLPLIHNDPFDRLLIAQAKHEGLTLLTTDKAILKYEGFQSIKV